ncbi:iron-sulfur cluster repair protein YtfE (RIC family) [Evansella vedderi]|uniref:Iron-sulfur cluster repair protein YtfE (RIC family) n=1 Tax=Evansella vedderi TaxID=38282 RepID=A0ABU0A3C4_9BACI|nr:hemerythrin domain-containing protein [Evansella vedderi]MDQ0257991.1 iron-sulfur cluster repair protein YtfE (RIC family) [Evansella vedderi]
MAEFQGFCSLNVEKPEKYCYALEELVVEHIPLKKKLDRLYYLGSLLAYDPTREDKFILVEKIYNEMTVFKAEIEPHTYKEDQYLFHLVAGHIGREGGPIPVMEDDHELVRKNIGLFFNKHRELDRHSLEEDIRELAHYICVMFHTLTDHFLKEEEIMFPIAENILTDKEKKKLEEVYRKMSIA